MEERYLIAHKVRGELSFDVAQRVYLSCGRALWWIPTSGHQAFPLRYQRLDQSLAERLSADVIDGEEWRRLREHYPEPEQRPSLFASLFARVRRLAGTEQLSVATALAHLLERSLSREG